MGVEDLKTNKPDLKCDVPENNERPKAVLLLEGPKMVDSCLESLEDLRLSDPPIYHEQKFSARNNPYLESNESIESLQSATKVSPKHSETEVEIKYFLEQQMQYVEEERKWLKYKVDSLTQEQSIILCIIGQMLFGFDEIGGSPEEVPTPEEGKQTLLVMSYGDHWVLKDLSAIMDFSEKVNTLLRTFGGLFDWTTNRTSMECIIMRHIGISRPNYNY